MKAVFCMLRSAIQKRDGGAESLRNLVDGMCGLTGIEISAVSSFGSYPSHYSYAPYPWREDSKVFHLIRYFYRTVEQIAPAYDIIVLILPNPAFGLLADMIKKHVKKPIIVNYESRWHALKGYHFAGDNLSWRNIYRLISFNKITSRLSQKLCDKYVVSTHFQKNELIDIGYKSDQVAVIPNSTNTSKYRFQYAHRNYRKENSLIMYLGHFNYSKGVDILIRAMAIILQSFPATTLSLIWSGAGSEYQSLSKLIRYYKLTEHVELIKSIVNVSEYLSHADVLALPYRSLSKTRIIPSLLLEAFSVGVPLVVSDCDPIGELVDDHKNGIVTPTDNPYELARGIIEFLKDEDLGNLVIQSQREVAKKQFSHDVVAEKYYNLFMEVLGG
jgi:glycosyltransferase involved in cell wall biosynthesis